jgi:hypothetical protein
MIIFCVYGARARTIVSATLSSHQRTDVYNYAKVWACIVVLMTVRQA